MSRIGGVLSIVAAAASCAAPENRTAVRVADAGSVETPVQVAQAKPLPNQVGNYLAARHARATGDLNSAIGFALTVLEVDPVNPELLRTVTMMMAVEGRVPEAVEMGRRLLDVKPDADMARLILAVEDLRAARYEDAESGVTGLKSGVATIVVPLVRAWALVGLARYDEALSALSVLEQNRGARALKVLHEALILDAAGRTETAETTFRSLTEEGQTGSLRQVRMLGSLLERTDRVPEARALYESFLAENPGTDLLEVTIARLDAGEQEPPPVASPQDGLAEGLFAMANSLRRQAGRETALALANMALHLRPNFPPVQLLLGDLYETAERLEMANAAYRAIDPKSSFSWSARLRIASNLNQMDRTDDAVSTLEAMATERPDGPEPLISVGDILRSHERFVEAAAAYDRAIDRIGTLEPRHWSLLYARGIALERSKLWPRAEADFLKALEFEPEQPYVLNYLGYSWVDQGLNLDRAQGMIKKAVRLRPHDGYIVDSLGWVYYRLGDYEKAVRELERAVELRPEDPVINDHLGDAYWRVGRQAEARFQWRRSLSLDPTDDVRATLEQKLKQGLVEAANPTPERGG